MGKPTKREVIRALRAARDWIRNRRSRDLLDARRNELRGITHSVSDAMVRSADRALAEIDAVLDEEAHDG